MIYIWSGLPGNYKTCSAIEFVNERFVKKEKREVYAYNIKDLDTDKLPGWHNVETLEEFKNWWKFPKGSILLGDEAQEYLPQRSGKDKPPEWVERYAMHRHTDKFAENSGAYDIIFITQDVMFLDIFVRRLCQSFRHLKRPLGLNYANVAVYDKVVDPDDYHDKQRAIENFRYKPNKFYFDVYKSADVHTIKRTLPWKKLAILGVIIGVVIACGVSLYGLKDKFGGDKSKVEVKGNPVPAKNGFSPGGGGMGGGAAVDRLDTTSLASYVPRVAGLPHTAPRYDEVTKPTTAPMPVACVAKKNDCVCFTQQATKMYVPEQQCREIIANGYFMDFDPMASAGGSGAGGRGVAAPAVVAPVAAQNLQPPASYQQSAPININVGTPQGAEGGQGRGRALSVSEMNLRPLDGVRSPKW